MILPQMRYSESRTRSQVLQFKGIQYGRYTKDGEFSETLNLSTRSAPSISQRAARGTVTGKWSKPSSVYAKDKLCVVDGTDFYYDNVVVGQVTEGEKYIVSVNSKILIFPDKVYYDTEKELFGSMTEQVTAKATTVTFTENTISLTQNPTEDKTLSDFFAEGQAIEISGASEALNNKIIVIRGIDGNTITCSDHTFLEGVSTTDVTFSRNVPDLLYPCECNNRLWGVSGNVIWGSALGDPLTFYHYDGVSTDSYAVTVGTDGVFTGCCSYSSNVLFFKEDVMYKLLGSQPSEYRLYSYSVPGVELGSAKSLCVINEVLYYKGSSGVYAYSGGTPYLLTECFGTKRYRNGVGGSEDGQRYLISMQDIDTQEWGLWVFDCNRLIWLREDRMHVVDFTRYGGSTCFLASDGTIYQTGKEDEEEGRFPWEALLAPFDWAIPERKQYTKLYIQAELEPGAYMKVELKEDDHPFRQAFIHYAKTRKTLSIPIFPSRCDTLQVKLSGKGRCLISQVAREYVIGGER